MTLDIKKRWRNPEFEELVDKGVRLAWHTMHITEYAVYMYFRRGGEDWYGQLIPVQDCHTPPDGTELAFPERLPRNLDYQKFHEFVRSRVTRLPLLPSGGGK